jgi:hypothetical protein
VTSFLTANASANPHRPRPTKEIPHAIGAAVTLRPTWLSLHPAFDPLRPADDTPAQRRVERPYTPLPDILSDLAFPEDYRRELIVGASGAGKTTELRAIQRSAPDLLTVHVDLVEHFEARGDVTALDRLHAWEVLLLIGLAVYRFGAEGLGHKWTSSRPAALTAAIARVTDGDPATINLSGLVGELALVVSTSAEAVVPGAAAALQWLKAAANNVSASVPLGMRRPADALPDGDARVHDLLVAVNGMIVELHQTFHLRTLLLVDGIDRGGADLAQRLFEDSALLAQLPCHAVMTAPLSLRHRNLRGWRSRFLGNVPVLEPHAPLVPAGKIQFFRDLWRSRVAGAAAPLDLIPEPLLDRLAWASGGLVRQFCELVQGVIRRSYAADTPANAAIVDAEIDDWRRRWEADLDASIVQLLRGVLAARDLTGDDRERALLDQRCIVAWPNDSVWYYPHPLLLLRKVAPPDA